MEGTVVSVGGDVAVSGWVAKDLVVLGGSGVVSGRVGGDVLVLGGEATIGAGGTVGGRLRSVSALEAAFLAELETSPLQGRGVSLLLLAFRLLLLSFWLGAGLLLLRLRPRRVQAAAASVPADLAMAAGLGICAVLSAVLLATFSLAAFPPGAGLLLVLGLALLFVAAKVFGLAALFVAVGRGLARRERRGSPFFGDPAALSIGLVPFGLASLLPGVGPLVWGAVSLLGIGLAIRTAFGAQGSVLSAARAA